ncbi:MAG: aldo/keto reductase [Anaerotruncus sp.]|nr:aldo/keto reductase [Anaerotruncus sp.]
MQTMTDSYTLQNGVTIPCVGFGTWQTPAGEVAVESVKEAIRQGYRHIDTAARYENEQSVGQAIKECGVPREELFITTKLANTDHGYKATLEAFERSMEKLGLEVLDLYLVHWPNPLAFRDCFEQSTAETWQAMEELYQSGKVRAIGVSNYFPRHLEVLDRTAKIPPMVNQIRLYPGYRQQELVEYCRNRGMLLEAYSPLGTGKLLDAPELVPIAERYGKSVAQVCLRWSLQMGFLPLPKSVTPARIKQNLELFDFSLSSADMAVLSNLENHCGPGKDPDTIDF